MSAKPHNMEVRSDADLQAIQTSVAFRNISDAVEQYRRQFGLAFLALIAFSAVHVGLVVIANLYTMQTRVSNGLLTAATDSPAPVGVASTTESVDLSYIMTNMDEHGQIKALSDMKSASFVDANGNYRQYTVTGFQLGGWKRSEVKLYTSVGHILEYVRGKGVRVFSETGATAGEANFTKRNLLKKGASPTSVSTFTSWPTMDWPLYSKWLEDSATEILKDDGVSKVLTDVVYNMDAVTGQVVSSSIANLDAKGIVEASLEDYTGTWMNGAFSEANKAAFVNGIVGDVDDWSEEAAGNFQNLLDEMYAAASDNGGKWNQGYSINASRWTSAITDAVDDHLPASIKAGMEAVAEKRTQQWWKNYANYLTHLSKSPEAQAAFQASYDAGWTWAPTATWAPTDTFAPTGLPEIQYWELLAGSPVLEEAKKIGLQHYGTYYNGTKLSEYGAYLSQAGGDHVDAAYAVMSDVITEISSSVNILVEGFSMYKSTGWIGDTTTLAPSALSAVGSSDYGCSGKSLTAIQAFETDAGSNAIDVCDTGGNMIGGFFFSEILGTFEAFLTHVPSSYCTAVNTFASARKRSLLGGELDGMTESKAHFVYMLHGWGENADFLLHMSAFVASLHHECLPEGTYVHNPVQAPKADYSADCIASDGFVMICPEDGSTPYGGKTWYRNNMFTGYHMDMIMFELPNYMQGSMMLDSYSKSLFGFSMGAFGTVSMLLTYSSFISAAAAFNGPMDANQCFYAATCHLECGVDAIMCELLWTTVNVAFNPFILVQTGKQVDTTGYYEPVAYGMAAAIATSTGNAKGKCYASASDPNFKVTIFTGTSGRLFNNDDESVESGIAGNFFFDRPGTSCSMAWECLDLKSTTTPWATNSDTYFWLNPIYFTIATANFAPSHNPVTGDPVTVTPYFIFGTTSYWHSFFNALPILRISKHPDTVASTSSPVYLMMGCDSNDPFGLYAIMNEFALAVKAADTALMINGAYIYESSQSHGHDFSESDCKLALQWFSEALDEGNTVASDGSVVWATTARQSCWIRPDEATPVLAGGLLSYPISGYNDPNVADCANYVGAWYPGETEAELIESTISQILSFKAQEQKEYFDDQATDTEYIATVSAAQALKTSYLAAI